jgi:transposase-like protein
MYGKLNSLTPSEFSHLHIEKCLSQNAIAAKFGVTPMSLHHWRIKNCISIRPYNVRKDYDAESIVYLYFEKRMTMQEIADLFGCKSKSTVSKYMKLAGLHARNPSECRIGRYSSSPTKFTSSSLRKMWNDGVFKNRPNTLKLLNKDIIFQQRRFAGLALKPNKVERKVIDMLDKTRWRYTGDGSFLVNGHAPDFVNCNGEKKVILVNGIYWHMKRRGLGRSEAEVLESKSYNDFGFDVIFIWEDEIGEWVSGL